MLYMKDTFNKSHISLPISVIYTNTFKREIIHNSNFKGCNFKNHAWVFTCKTIVPYKLQIRDLGTK